ncbi:ABC transporter permease [Novosphingobium piscinae]|uniref:FtsX-like permease family protein n=1 Tax=Novosphingobium piscinae TaxID=1507448 RepID=A0A7X1FVS1_9SPHN|nr:ABC transporter permease [Novosphingobium piscinae]MBC2667866.1 FtsX-like permease family protein [Novosphingobium piscinae]
MKWIAIRMLTGDRVKFAGLVFGVVFSTLLITQQLTIFVNLLLRGAAAVHEVPSADIWVMDPAGRTPDVTVPLPATSLQRVRGVAGVAWAAPLMRAGASVRTPDGALEPVTVVGVDDATLTGLPRTVQLGRRAALREPDAVFIDAMGARRLFGTERGALDQRLELNDRRAVVRGIVDSEPTFTNSVMLYTRYANALEFLPGSRNRLSFILVQAQAGANPFAVARQITAATGLRARVAGDFAQDGIDYIIDNTGIPINFGITVALGVIVGIAIVGLTFSLFIRDNIRQFGALKAIGVTNGTIRQMVAAQSALVALIGYGLGLALAIGFLELGRIYSDAFKGFYTPWQIPLIAAVMVACMILLTGLIALRQVLRTEPAEVFR